jgi:hypothetical protein
MLQGVSLGGFLAFEGPWSGGVVFGVESVALNLALGGHLVTSSVIEVRIGPPEIGGLFNLTRRGRRNALAIFEIREKYF